jgi:hypothetical protein
MASAADEACRLAREAFDELDEPVFDGPTAESDIEPAATGAVGAAADTEAASEAVTAAEALSPLSASEPSAEAAVVPEPAASLGRALAPEEPTEKSDLDWLVIDLRSPQPQAIIRLLRQDSGTMTSLVEHLAGTDPAARRCWQLTLSNFVDSVAGAAIDDAWFEFPPGIPFWDIFTPEQAREVARGLSALGFRYDGFGCFADGRVPSQRDLALAVGAAGLLPARIRYWPKPEETAELYRSVRVSADAFIAAKAPALTLGELVSLLGRRADGFADLWNDWPRVRPLLFSTAH